MNLIFIHYPFNLLFIKIYFITNAFWSLRSLQGDSPTIRIPNSRPIKVYLIGTNCWS